MNLKTFSSFNYSKTSLRAKRVAWVLNDVNDNFADQEEDEECFRLINAYSITLSGKYKLSNFLVMNKLWITTILIICNKSSTKN